VAKEGKLTLVSADGFRLAMISLDYDDGEGQALIIRDDLKGIVSALKRAKRARVSFEPGGESLDGTSLIIDTELIRYKYIGWDGSYPDYEKLIPTGFNCQAHFDTVEAIKAVNSLKALSNGKDYPIDLTIGDGKLVMANPDDTGQAELVADTDGEVIKVRVDGGYLAQALKACGGMVDFEVTSPSSPMLFSANGYQLVVMPMLTSESQSKGKQEAEAETTDTEPVPAEPEAEQAEPIAEKPKRKRSKVKEPVAVA